MNKLKSLALPVLLLAPLAALHATELVTDKVDQPPFPRPPLRPIGSFRGLPQKANSLQ
ncbi:MAG: hypothetical protein NTV46_14885 [Verrucomicrobia bacterium]|nr:hypothetical protein [Verrucomicrobiota bacterium]